MKTNLANNLRILRVRMDISQSEVARRLHIGRARYQYYEDNKAEPPLWLLLKIAKFHRITVDQLLTELPK